MDFSPAWTALQSIISGFTARLPYLLLSVFVFGIFYLMAKGIRVLVRRVAERRKRHRNLGMVLGRLAQALIVLLGLLVALVIVLPGFTPGQLLELLGIGSVAIGFAFRDILQNFLAGILILLTEPFRIGDQIVVNNYEGTVEEIQTRATTLKTYDGRRIVIPNANLFTNSVIVNTAFDKRRIQYDIGVGYGDDIDKARALILEAMKSVDSVLDNPAPDAIVVDLAGSSVNIRARWWVQPPRQADTLDHQDRVLTAIKNNLTAHGIDLPFPTQQILFHDQTEETDGDRRRQREGWPAGSGDVPRRETIGSVVRQMAKHGMGQDGSDGVSQTGTRG